MPTPLRVQRVQELLKRQLGEVIRRELATEGTGIITVNEVIASKDLQVATVYVGILGTAEETKAGMDMLNKERKRIQNLVGRAVVLRYTPVLRFVLDESISRGNRVLEILEEIERSSPPHEATPEDH
jgi:ribosome-binding factor A